MWDNYPFFFFEKQTHTHKGEGKGFKGTSQLYSKAMVTFKGRWSKLYYTQHTLLSNVGQLPFFFFFLRNKHTHKGEGKVFLVIYIC